jgi:hypothetical protein
VAPKTVGGLGAYGGDLVGEDKVIRKKGDDMVINYREAK